jgi:Domain of unknown function (DUF222)/HNH endonuclease
VGACDVRDPDAVDDPVAVLCARAREVSVATARLLEAIVAVASDTRPGFDADEVAFALAWTQSAARSQVEFGRYLIRVVPEVFAALGRGAIDVRRAWVFADVLGLVDDSIAAAIAAAVLPVAGDLTTSQLRDRLRRAVLKADPDAAGRTAKSVADRHVACQADREGTASLFGVRLPPARATAAFERVDAFARGRKSDGDGRTMDQLRADTFLDLLEGVGIGSSPVHRAGVVELTVPWTTATDATNDSAVLAGYGPIDADTARDIIANDVARLATASSRCERAQWRHTVTDDDGRLLSTRRRPRIELVSRPIVGALGDAGAGNICPAPLAPVAGDPTLRTPSSALARWIATRDRTCRAPGCRVPARAADIDHTLSHADGGPTSHDNLSVICRHHHRLKHDGGWRVTQPQPGTLVWTSPGGREYSRQPDPP